MPYGRDVATCEPRQLGCRLVVVEVATILDDPPYLHVQTLDQVVGVDHAPHVRWEGEERNDVLPRTSLGSHDREIPGAAQPCTRALSETEWKVLWISSATKLTAYTKIVPSLR